MPTEQMRFGSSISDDKDPQAALQKGCDDVLSQLQGHPCHAAFLFISSLYRTDWQHVAQEVRCRLGNPLLIGCTGGGVLGKDQELEFTPAVSLAGAYLPRVNMHPFVISPEDLQEDRGPGFWIEKLGATPGDEPIGVLLPEPFSCDCMRLIESLKNAYPKMPLIGGLASGADDATPNALFLNDKALKEGAVGVVFTGDVALQTIVSQGCRPIGRPFIVTKADDNVLLELAGVPAVEALRTLLISLSDQDKALAQRALFVGVVMNEQKDKFRRGDFLIRNLIGMDPSSGALAVGDKIRVGQTVQFQVRDAATSKEDLQHLLQEQSPGFQNSPSAGGLLFSCLGRGRDLYGEPNYDIRAIQSAIGNRPIAGFFCNGEIGPVGGRNFIHGFTSSLGLFQHKSGL